MPKVWAEDDEYAIIRELLDEQRHHRTNTAAQLPTWTHDTFTAPATYQLTSIPYGINVLADNGSALSEGTDYTVDYTTGLITFTVGRTAGHVIFVSYVTNGDLIALSGVVDTGAVITDTFNRPNQTGLGTRSDGGLWLSRGGNWHIVSNTAQNQWMGVSDASGSIQYADAGSATQDVNAIVGIAPSSTSWMYLVLAADPATGNHYRVQWLTASTIRVDKYASGWGPGGTSTVHSFTGLASQSGNTACTIRAIYDGAGNFDIYCAGVHVGTCTDSSSPLTGTNVGFTDGSDLSTGGYWDNIQVF